MPLTAEKKTNVVFLAQDKTGRAFRSMAAETDKLQRKWTGLSLKAAGFVTVAAAAAAGLGLLAKRAIENTAALGDTAEKIGLSAAALQEMRFAAEQTGVAQETLDMALQRFSRRVGEAAQGQGELRATLEQYGVAVTDTEGRARALEDVLGDYAEAVRNAGSEQEQLRLAFKAFDSEGAALVNLMRGGRDGLAAMREEAQRLGVVLDDQMVRQAQDANDAMSRMARIAGVNLDRVLIALGPTIEAVADAFAEAGPWISSAANALAKFIGGVDMLAFQGLQQELANINDRIEKTNKIIETGRGIAKGAAQTRIGDLQNEKRHLEILMQTRVAEAQLHQKILKDLGTGDAGNAAEKQREQAQQLLQRLDEQWMALTGREAELIDMRHEQEMAKLREFLANKAITEAEFDEAEFASRQAAMERLADLQDWQREEELSDLERHLQEMRDAEARSAAQMQMIWQSGLSGKLQIGGKVLGQLASLMDSGSKKMFAIGKAAAIAQTIIDTYAAAQTQFKFYSWNPPLAYAAAAAAIAAGLARVRAITSTQFGGGASGAPAGGSPPSGTSPNVPDVPALDTQRPAVPRNIVINIPEGSVFTDAWLREVLFPRMQDALDDGTTLRTA